MTNPPDRYLENLPVAVTYRSPPTFGHKLERILERNHIQPTPSSSLREEEGSLDRLVDRLKHGAF